MEKINVNEKIFDDLKNFNYSKDIISVFKDCIEFCALKTACLVDKKLSNENKLRLEEIFNSYKSDEKEKALIIVQDIFDILAQFKHSFDDYLGKIYMELIFTYDRKSKAQYFTPYHISRFMAEMVIKENEHKKFITINDPCCGAGGMCIAALDILNSKNINYLKQALIYANDIDKTCVYMTYLQLNFAGAAAIVEHKDTLTNKSFDTFRTLGFYMQQLQTESEM